MLITILRHLPFIALILAGLLFSVAEAASITWVKGNLPATTLGLLSLISGYICIENLKREKQLEELKSAFARAGAHAIPYSTTEEGLKQMAVRLQAAKKTVDQAAIAPSASDDEKVYEEYKRAQKKVLADRQVTYRYVAVFDHSRWERIAEVYPKDRKSGKYIKSDRYSVSYYKRQPENPDNKTPTPLSFAIFDETEVLVRYPNAQMETPSFISITEPHIVSLFKAYFNNRILRESKPLDLNNPAQIQEIQQIF